jgi:hypothetical protein
MKRPALLFSVAGALWALPALAQSGLSGIGFVQAEEGTWYCRGTDAARAFDCATKKCAAEGNGQQCHATRWCYPAGWSGVMVVWLSEFRSTVPLCGAPSEASVQESLKALCAGFDDGHRCDFVLLIGPDGKEQPVEGVIWPGPVMVPPGEDAAGAEDAGSDAPRPPPRP